MATEADLSSDGLNLFPQPAATRALPGATKLQKVGTALKQVDDQGVASDIGGGGSAAPAAPGFDQFDAPGVGDIFAPQVGWSYRTLAGASAPDGAVAAAGIPGAVRCRTAASTAFSDVYKNTDSVVFLGSGKWTHSCTIALDTLPDTSTLAFWAGFRDNSGYGAYFWGDSHANIQCVTEDSSGTVTTDSGVPWVVTVGGTDGNYVTLEVVVEAGVATFTLTPLGGSPTVKTISTHVPATVLQQHVFHVQPLASIPAVNVYLAYERLRWDP